MEQIDMPMCFDCETNIHVKELGPELMGSEYKCYCCKAQWVQEC